MPLTTIEEELDLEISEEQTLESPSDNETDEETEDENNHSEQDNSPNYLFDDESEAVTSERKHLVPLFETLSHPKPDTRLLQKHIAEFNSLAGIYLNIFLETSIEEAGNLYRDVLREVLVAEDICANDLSSESALPRATRLEIKDFLKTSNKLSQQLETLAEQVNEHEENHHLIVSNVLSETTSKLQNALQEFSVHKSNVLAEIESEEEEVTEVEEEEVHEEKEELFAISEPKKTGTNRWLIAATILTVAVSGILFFAEEQLNKSVKLGENAENINIDKFKESNHLTNAYRMDGMIFVTASDSWDKLSKTKKQGSLRDMLNYDSQQKIKTVFVTNGSGIVYGDISKEKEGQESEE